MKEKLYEVKKEKGIFGGEKYVVYGEKESGYEYKGGDVRYKGPLPGATVVFTTTILGFVGSCTVGVLSGGRVSATFVWIGGPLFGFITGLVYYIVRRLKKKDIFW